MLRRSIQLFSLAVLAACSGSDGTGGGGAGGVAATCGNGVVDDGEGCDDGNTDVTDACAANCQLAQCGDGITRQDLTQVDEGFEACDDGNDIDHDACRSSCQPAVCGDGVTRMDRSEGEPGFEACDDANDDDRDLCTAACLRPPCAVDRDCPPSLWCRNERCNEDPPDAPQCTQDSDCEAGFSCREGLCIPIDSDGDGIADLRDNCPGFANANQTDTDGDGAGDDCDPNPARPDYRTPGLQRRPPQGGAMQGTGYRVRGRLRALDAKGPTNDRYKLKGGFRAP